MFLTENDIELQHVRIATADGQAPRVIFGIVNMDNVLRMLDENTYLRGERQDLHTERLQINIDDTNNTIEFRRTVGPRTLAYAANYSLALSLLALVLSPHDFDNTRNDIHAMSPSITDDHIQAKREELGVQVEENIPMMPAFR
jgi:hypothetical protein